MSHSKSDCKTALVEAKDSLGYSPSMAEYRGLDISPSAKTIARTFGGWNDAKIEAGLSVLDKKRGHPVDEHYFEHIDTVEKAYWLGFLYGDGSAYYSESDSIKIQLQISDVDVEHVEKYKEAIGSGHKVNRFEQGGRGKAGLTVTNRRFADNLASHGFEPGKTTSSDVPDLSSEDLRRGFIRGLSDADGHVDKYQWTIVGSNVERFEKLSDWIPFPTYVQRRTVRLKNSPVLTLNGVGLLPKFYSWLYPDGEDTIPSLDRKAREANAISYK